MLMARSGDGQKIMPIHRHPPALYDECKAGRDAESAMGYDMHHHSPLLPSVANASPIMLKQVGSNISNCPQSITHATL